MVIAIKEKDRVVVAVSNVDMLRCVSSKDALNEDNMLIKIKGDTIYCFTTFGRYTDMFMCDDKFFDFEVNEKNIVKEIIPYMVNRIREEIGDTQVKKSELNWQNSLTIIKNNKIFDITPDFTFNEEKDYVCHGYSSDFLIGVLDATKGEKAEVRIKKAIDIYFKLLKSSLYPLVVVDSKDKKIQVWEE